MAELVVQKSAMVELDVEIETQLAKVGFEL